MTFNLKTEPNCTANTPNFIHQIHIIQSIHNIKKKNVNGLDSIHPFKIMDKSNPSYFQNSMDVHILL